MAERHVGMSEIEAAADLAEENPGSERQADSDYEGFRNVTRRNHARIQRAYMFKWRLLCSGVAPDLVDPYCIEGALAYKKSQELNDALHRRGNVLTWKELERRCGRSLAHYVGSGADFRVPTVETLAAMAAIGGRQALSAFLCARRLDLRSVRVPHRLKSSGRFSAS